MNLIVATLVVGAMLISPLVASAQDPNAARRAYELERWRLQQEEQRANRQQQLEQLQRDRQYQLEQQRRVDEQNRWQNEQQRERAVETYKINEERRRYEQERSDVLEREEDAKHEGDPAYQLGKDIGNLIRRKR